MDIIYSLNDFKSKYKFIFNFISVQLYQQMPGDNVEHNR